MEVMEDSARNEGFAVTLAPIGKVHPSTFNPRKNFDEAGLQELAESIGEHGLIQPVTVRPDGTGNFEILCGERRFRACKRLGRASIEVVIKEVDDREARQIALIENLVRRDIDPIEEAEGYASLRDMDMKVVDIAARVNRSESAVSNAIRLLKLPEEARQAVRDGSVSVAAAKALLPYVDHPKVFAVAMGKINKGVPSKDIERLFDGSNTWDLERAGAMKSLYGACYPACKECRDYRKMKTGYWGCLDPARHKVCCAAAAEAKRAEDLARAGIDDPDSVLDLSKMSYESYASLSRSRIPDGCKEDCPNRKTGYRGGYTEEVCVDKGCFDRLTRAQSRNANKITKIEIAEKLEKAIRTLQLPSDRNVRYATAAICLNVISNAKTEDLQRAITDQRLELSGFLRGRNWNDDSHTWKQLNFLKGVGVTELILLTAELICLKNAENADPSKSCPEEPDELDFIVGVKPKVYCKICRKQTREPLTVDTPNGAVFVCSEQCVDEVMASLQEHEEEDTASESVEMIEDNGAENIPDGMCRICGCTDDNACEGGCYWVEPDLCSQCAERMAEEQAEEGCPKSCEGCYMADCNSRGAYPPVISTAEAVESLVDGAPCTQAELRASSTVAVPPIGDMVRAGDMIVPLSIEQNKGELVSQFDVRLEAGVQKVLTVEDDHLHLFSGGVISESDLNAKWRFYMVPNMVAIGDEIANIDAGNVSIYEVINKTDTEVRLKDTECSTNFPSHPNWNTFCRYHYTFISRMSEVTQ